MPRYMKWSVANLGGLLLNRYGPFSLKTIDISFNFVQVEANTSCRLLPDTQ